MRANLQKSLIWMVILSETSHVFCCVLPTLFSLIGILAGLGLVGVMPGFMVDIHNTLHAYELPMIALSGSVLLLGWGGLYAGQRLECRDSCCADDHCPSDQRRTKLVLKIATILFLFNILIYAGIHRSNWFILHVAPYVSRADILGAHAH